MIELHYPYYKNIVNMLGACSETWLVPLRIPITNPEWPSLCNPSIFIDGDNIRMIIRNVNYILHNSIDPYKFWSSWGPIHYITPNNDYHLRTRNFLCDYNKDSISYKLIDTSEHDKEPTWDFVGLEDARIVRWKNHLYVCGVRRDDSTDGTGRMEIMEIDENGKEISRLKVQVPWESYCEKNWVPIIDKPYHFMRTSNPTMIMKVNIKTGQSEKVIEKPYFNIENIPGIYNAPWQGETLFRGSSQVIPYKNGAHIAIVHTCELYFNECKRKVAKYLHHFIIWDKNWNIQKISPAFSFNNYHIEFTNGLAYKNHRFYIPFALQDGFSYLIEASDKDIEKIIDGTFPHKENFEFLPCADTYFENYDGFEKAEKEASWCLINGYNQESYIRYWRMYENSFRFPISSEKQIIYLLNTIISAKNMQRVYEVQRLVSEIETKFKEDPEILMIIGKSFQELNLPYLGRTYAERSIKIIDSEHIFQYIVPDQYEEYKKILLSTDWDGIYTYNQNSLQAIERVL